MKEFNETGFFIDSEGVHSSRIMATEQNTNLELAIAVRNGERKDRKLRKVRGKYKKKSKKDEIYRISYENRI